MKTPISHILRKLKPANHAKIPSPPPHLFNLPTKFPPNSPLIPQNRSKTLQNGPSVPKFLDSVPKFDKSTQRRSISSAESNPAAPDAASVAPPSEAIDAGSSIRKPLSLWPGMYHSPVTNALWEARSKFYEKISSENGSAQSELIAKKPSASRTSILYKFSSDYILREQYRNPWNNIRMGKLLEDLDALAGTISFKHCSGEDSSTRPLILVTASVDKMVLRKPIKVDTDLTIAGAVTWVGRSSMEIQLEVIQSSEETSDPLDAVALTANFTFVARDSETGKSAVINQITPESEKEKEVWKEAEERNKLRKKRKGEQKKEINDRDMDKLNEMLSEGRIFCDMPALAAQDSILIKDTCLQNSLMCQPQQRNIHGRIFGGFLMRRALELAFATAYAFAGSAPCFQEVDHVDFFKPVDVGNFLRFNSCVLYTELENPSKPLINVEVVAHVMRPELRSSEVSNKFYFTFTVNSDALRNGHKIRNVVPATEEEARRVIERMEAERSY
ncbi:acyl-coenzyme A thioesterase 2, chloroplastic-like isoform X1 [Salvia hispanica]|uniref:acyl-coenzyme A thioesterase 2, chloroplastic-like isoform X1 n=1 Tax=Salvia hispanica TaxID=49212 RepID=UPI0020099948|nr:acyl-coenzyme A thioesterase 2, chloroplastic-like isoform X1 [Salvia hispanica]